MNTRIETQDDGLAVARLVFSGRTICTLLAMAGALLVWAAVQVFHTGQTYENFSGAIAANTDANAKNSEQIGRMLKVLDEHGHMMGDFDSRLLAQAARLAAYEESLRSMGVTVNGLDRSLTNLSEYLEDGWAAQERRAHPGLPYAPPLPQRH